MAYVGRDFSPDATPGESEVYGFDFVNDLAVADSVDSATWAVTVVEGTDAASSASHVSGSTAILGSVVTQRIINLLPGVRYAIACTAVTAYGNTIILFSHVNCQAVT